MSNQELTGTPFGFRKEKGGQVIQWGARVLQGQGATGDVIRIVTKKGIVRRGILGRIHASFVDQEDGLPYNAWGLQQPEGHDERHPD